MRRLTFAILSALSLIVCLLALVLWIRGYRQADYLGVQYPIAGGLTRQAGLLSRPGRLGVYSEDDPDAGNVSLFFHWIEAAGVRLDDWDRPDTRTRVTIVGARYYVSGAKPYVLRQVDVRTWMVALLTAVLPAFWLRGWRLRRRKRLAGHCARCGYDLRASAGRCPECGTAIPAPVSA